MAKTAKSSSVQRSSRSGSFVASRVVLRDKSDKTIVVLRDAKTGRLTNERSAKVIDRGVKRLSATLERLAKK